VAAVGAVALTAVTAAAGPSAAMAAPPAVATPPAAAAQAMIPIPPVPIAHCIVKERDGSFRAVFGYYNPNSSPTTIQVGLFNYVWPGDLAGSIPTTFEPGLHKGVFATPYRHRNEQITWMIAGRAATAWPGTVACGPEVVLPTEGNGMGPIIVLGLSMVLSFLPIALRNRRRKRSA
jgi:hypothetical protein